MEAGKLDRRITLERYTTTYNEFNEPVEAWTTLGRVWASKRDVSDRERVAAAEVSAEISTRFQIRYSSTVADLSPKDRLTYEGRIYNISAVKEIGRREGLEISAAAEAD